MLFVISKFNEYAIMGSLPRASLKEEAHEAWLLSIVIVFGMQLGSRFRDVTFSHKPEEILLSIDIFPLLTSSFCFPLK